jgi:ketosteroid isomerase-like protein
MKRIFAAIFVIACAGTVVFGECSNSDIKALEAFDRAWGAAGDNGDANALSAILADDFVGMPGMMGKSATMAGQAAAYAAFKADPSTRDEVSHDRYLISCTPQSATITHRNIVSLKVGTGGRPQTLWSRSVHFLEKRGSKWQVVSNATHDMDDAMSLMYMEQDWNDANQARDKKWLDAAYAPDFQSISSTTGQLHGKADDIASTVNDKGVNELTETSNLDVRVQGNFASVTGIYRWKGKDEKGVAYDHRIRFMDTFIKRDGRWQIWGSAGAPIK